VATITRAALQGGWSTSPACRGGVSLTVSGRQFACRLGDRKSNGPPTRCRAPGARIHAHRGRSHPTSEVAGAACRFTNQFPSRVSTFFGTRRQGGCWTKHRRRVFFRLPDGASLWKYSSRSNSSFSIFNGPEGGRGQDPFVPCESGRHEPPCVLEVVNFERSCTSLKCFSRVLADFLQVVEKLFGR